MKIVIDDVIATSADYTYAARALERLAKRKRLAVYPLDGEARRASLAQAAVLERVARHLRLESEP